MVITMTVRQTTRTRCKAKNNDALKKILFLHDTNLSLLRGAELTIKQLTALGIAKGFCVETNPLQDFETTKRQIENTDLVVINSTSRCAFELPVLQHLIDGKKDYVKIEFDYNFCRKRTIACTVDPECNNCCDVSKFHVYRELFAKSRLNIFQSPKHYESHREFFGAAVEKHLIMPPTVDVDALRISEEKIENVIPFFGDLSFLKGGKALLGYARENPKLQFEVYGNNRLEEEIPANVIFKPMVPNDKVLEILGQTKTFFCQPFWPEPSGRLAAEAFLSGCEIIGNDRIGTFSFDFYPNDRDRAKIEMKQTLHIFWQKMAEILQIPKQPNPKLGKVLVKKTSGGIGDFFFCIPALYALAEVSEQLTFALASRLVPFFGKHLPGINVIDQETALATENQYNFSVELGNYPAYIGGFKLPNEIRYNLHKKVKQHAVRHYIDALAKFHPDCRTGIAYPYFERKPNCTTPYYTIHAGAGLLLKTWPLVNFANLIGAIRQQFPELGCKIIKGPDDPNPLQLLDMRPDFVEVVTGGMAEVGEIMSGALFHIGNDSGITHVAGAFNVPTVGIYGPTGPGAWGSFAEHSETVWGKPGKCDKVCDYNVILNCGDRVCLSSITLENVMGKLYKLLQNAYPEKSSAWMFNPNMEIYYLDSACQLKLDGNEFDINFTDVDVKRNVIRILSGDFSVANQKDMAEFIAFLQEQDLLFRIPKFTRLQGIKKPRLNVV